MRSVGVVKSKAYTTGGLVGFLLEHPLHRVLMSMGCEEGRAGVVRLLLLWTVLDSSSLVGKS
jgi:hypothetical protein